MFLNSNVDTFSLLKRIYELHINDGKMKSIFLENTSNSILNNKISNIVKFISIYNSIAVKFKHFLLKLFSNIISLLDDDIILGTYLNLGKGYFTD